jgi:hypothetical protein
MDILNIHKTKNSIDGIWKELPIELWSSIFSKLNEKDRNNCSLSCKYLNYILFYNNHFTNPSRRNQIISKRTINNRFRHLRIISCKTTIICIILIALSLIGICIFAYVNLNYPSSLVKNIVTSFIVFLILFIFLLFVSLFIHLLLWR